MDKKHYDSKNYKIDMESVFKLSKIEDFIQLYKFTTYTTLSSIFGLSKQIYFKQNDQKDSHRIIDALFLFKEGVKPEWEDPCHQKGGILQADLNLNGMQFLDDFWETVLTLLVSADFEGIDEVTGIRILNNTKTHNTIRFEIWMKCGLEFYRQKDQKQFLINKEKIDKIRESFTSSFSKEYEISGLDFAFKDIYK